MTPAWLLEREVGLCPCNCTGSRSKGSFVDKTINGASRVLRVALFTDDIAARPGLLQRIDPRVKVVTMLALVVAAALVRNIPVLIALYVLGLLLAAASRVSVRFFVERVWLFIPIFTAIVVLPAAFSFITPGHIVVPLGHWFGQRVGLTSQGLRSAALVVVRVAVSISFVMLVALTTTWTRLLAALRAMFLPRMFVLVLGMAYRYIFHLLTSVTEMYEARKARTVRFDTTVSSGRAFVAATAGTVFGKAHATSEEVYQAMVARGYTGRARPLSGFTLQLHDAAWIAGCTIVVACVLLVDRALGR